MLERVKESAAFLHKFMPNQPSIAIILGSGLGGLVNRLEILKEIPYSEIPNFPQSTVKGHKGTWIFGKLNGIDIVVLSGRFHYYEGYTMKEVTFPIQVMRELGIEKLILSNAAGGMNPTFQIGDIMVIRDEQGELGRNRKG